MKNFLSSLLATIIGILIMTIVVVLIFIGIVAASTSKEVPELKENSILLAKFGGPIADRSDDNPFSNFLSGNPYMGTNQGLDQILKDLEKAKRDDNIKGIFLNLMNVPSGVATLSEVRNALLDFKESGKFIYAYADAYTHKSYYLASVADSIFMTPEGMFLFTGLSAEGTFYKKAMDKLGIEMQVIKHGTYKGANERFTRENFSDANKEQIEAYVGSIWDNMISDISASRNISEKELNLIADELTTLDNQEIVNTGMIDGLIYYDEMLTLMKGKLGVEEEDDLESISLAGYKDVPLKEKKEYSRDKIAVIYAMGLVVDGSAGEGYIGSERIAKAIRKARRDKSVKAIVFRVNSGGGSMIASDVIYREVLLAAEEKPFVASMGGVAASGGYYIVAPADTILASPTTVTGSIGVYLSLPNIEGLMNEKLGITTDVINTNRHSDIMTISKSLDPDEKVLIQKFVVDEAYGKFLSIVSEGRNMTVDEVDAIAGGRVWSGSDAIELGLIDMFGGLEKSIEVAAQMASLENYRVQSLPKLEDPLSMIMKELTGIKAKMIKKELGDQYQYYKRIQEIREMKGLQAIIPYDIELH